MTIQEQEPPPEPPHFQKQNLPNPHEININI